MELRRPRLFVGSMVVALVVGVGGGLLVADMLDDDPPPDAVLTDFGAVETFPVDGLGNDDVEGDPFPIVDLSDRDGNVFSSASLLGQPLVVNFWYSTCPPCAKELPDFAEVHAEVGARVRFVGVNTIDSVETMERFAGERGVAYELYRDDLAEMTDAIGAAAFPITIFVTSDGTIVDQAGPLDAGELRDRVADLEALDGRSSGQGSS